MPHRVAALAGHATVYDAEDNAVCQTKGSDAEATANRIARALDAAPALLEALADIATKANRQRERLSRLLDLLPDNFELRMALNENAMIVNESRAAMRDARGEVTA